MRKSLKSQIVTLNEEIMNLPKIGTEVVWKYK